MSGLRGVCLGRHLRHGRRGALTVLSSVLLSLAACTGAELERVTDEAKVIEPSSPLVMCANADPLRYSEVVELPALDADKDQHDGIWLAALAALPDQPLLFGDHYRVISMADAAVTLAAVEGDQVGSITLWRQGERWITFSTPSVRDCEVRVQLEDGHAYADVYRDPTWTPAPQDTAVKLVVYEPVCESEREPIERFDTTLVERYDEVVVSIVWVPPGDAVRCHGRQAIPLTLTLDAPLSDRRLLDGTHVPPRRIYRPGVELTGSTTPGERRSQLAGTPDHEGSPAESGDRSRVHTMIDE